MKKLIKCLVIVMFICFYYSSSYAVDVAVNSFTNVAGSSVADNDEFLFWSVANAGVRNITFAEYANYLLLEGLFLTPTGSAAGLTSFPTLNQNTTGTASNLSGTPALPNGVTATTQPQGDNSTKLATTKYVDIGLNAFFGSTTIFGDNSSTVVHTYDTSGADLTWSYSASGNIWTNASLGLYPTGDFYLGRTGVDHGMTTQAASTAVFFQIGDLSPTDGGTWMRSLSDTDTIAFLIEGILGSVNPTDTTPAVAIRGAKKDGTGVQSLGSAETVFQVQNSLTDVLTVYGNGVTNIPTGATYNINGTPHTHAYQASDSDLTIWAGLTPSAFFQTLVDDANATVFLNTIGAQALLTYPVTGLASPTAGYLTKWGPSGNALVDGPKIGTFTDTKWCNYTTANGLQCTENTPGGYTNLTSFVSQTAYRLFYSDSGGNVTELSFGSDGTYLRSNGPSAAPTFDTPSGAAHDAVTLSTDLGNNLLGLSTQQITLDNQTANYVFAGPASGDPAAPAFRALTDNDIPDTITASNYLGVSAKAADSDLLDGHNSTYFQVSLSLLAGTYTDTNLCTYTSSGTLLNCNTPASTFEAHTSNDIDPDRLSGDTVDDNLIDSAIIVNAAADGSTKGVAAFTAADFNATTGVVSIDYTNGQAASGSLKGFLTSTDWTTFNNKQNALSGGTDYLRPTTDVDDTPVNGETAQPISSNWAYDHSILAASEGAIGHIELATTAEAVTGTDSTRAITAAGLTARLAAPGTIGGTTPGSATFTTIGAGGGGFAVTADGNMTANKISVGTPGAVISSNNGSMTILGAGDGTDESITVNLNADNVATWTSETGVTSWNLNSFTISANGFVPDTNDGAALGTTSLMFSDLFLASGAVINFNNGDVTLTHSADTLTLGGGTLALGANNLTMTGSIGATGARVTKGWFTDIESTNAIAGSITGNAATVTVADAADDTTTWPMLATGATGSLAPATDSSLTYNASTGIMSATGFTAGGAALAGGTNTFSITNGTASLDVAAAATVNIDTSLTVQTGAVTLTGNAAGSTLVLPSGSVTLPSAPIGGTYGSTANTIGKRGADATTVAASGITEDGTDVNFGALNLVTTGKVQGKINTVVNDANATYTITTAQAQYGTFFLTTNAATTTYVLPSVAAGMSVCARMSQGNAQVLRIDTDGTDYIVMSTGARTSAAGDYYGASSDDKNQICVVGFDTTDWYVTSEVGTWTEQ